MGDCRCGSSSSSPPPPPPSLLLAADLAAQQICPVSVSVGLLSSLSSLSPLALALSPLALPSLCVPPSLPDCFRLRGILLSANMSPLLTCAEGVVASNRSPLRPKAAEDICAPAGVLAPVAEPATLRCACIIGSAVLTGSCTAIECTRRLPVLELASTRSVFTAACVIGAPILQISLDFRSPSFDMWGPACWSQVLPARPSRCQPSNDRAIIARARAARARAVVSTVRLAVLVVCDAIDGSGVLRDATLLSAESDAAAAPAAEATRG